MYLLINIAIYLLVFIFNVILLIDIVTWRFIYECCEANRIFTEVKNDGIRIVVKNNTPECVLISPKDYQALVERYEDALLMAEANNRLSNNVGYISHNDILNDLNINEQDLENIDIELE